MLYRCQRARSARDRGFTLIELLVVLIIIGILAAIAVPVYLNQRQKAFKAQVKADTHNLVINYESWPVNHGGAVYPDIWYQWGGTTSTPPADFDLRLSPNTQIHAFDFGLYYPGVFPGGVGKIYCIEIVFPGLPAQFYRSDVGTLMSSACQSVTYPAP